MFNVLISINLCYFHQSLRALISLNITIKFSRLVLYLQQRHLTATKQLDC